jgi:hypothetical protein
MRKVLAIPKGTQEPIRNFQRKDITLCYLQLKTNHTPALTNLLLILGHSSITSASNGTRTCSNSCRMGLQRTTPLGRLTSSEWTSTGSCVMSGTQTDQDRKIRRWSFGTDCTSVLHEVGLGHCTIANPT